MIVRWLDAVVVGLIKVFIGLAHLKSRDPNEHTANLFRPDPHQQTRIRGWKAVLQWSPQKRVGCFVGVLIGVGIGGVILWYGLN